MRVLFGFLSVLAWAVSSFVAAQLSALRSVDSLWEDADFRLNLTASYGSDARIEPLLNTAEKEVLDAVATAMAERDLEAAAAEILGYDELSESAALFFTLGNIRFEQGQLEDAMENFEVAIELLPSFRDAHRNLAVALIRAGEDERAGVHLVRALELGANDGLTMGLLGHAHFEQGEFQAALQAYRLAQLSQPRTLSWKLGEAQALLRLDDARASVSVYGQLIEDYPQDVSLYLGQANAFHRLGELEGAVANLQILAEMGRLAAADRLSLARYFLQLQLPDQAMEHALVALQDGDELPPLGDVLLTLRGLVEGEFYERAQRLDERVMELEGYTQRLQQDVGLRHRRWRYLALLDLQLERSQQGAQRVQQVLEENPQDAQALLLLGQFYQLQQQPYRAAVYFEQAATDADLRARALRLHGVMLVQQRNYASALELLEQALVLEPDEGLREYVMSVRNLAR